MTLRHSLSFWVYGVLIFIGSNSLCVTHWKLDRDNNKVVPIETQQTPKHLAAGVSFLDGKQTRKTDEMEDENIMSTLKQRYSRSLEEIETDLYPIEIDPAPAPNTNEICSVFPCDKPEDNAKNGFKIEQSLSYESTDKTLSKSDLTEDTETEMTLEPDYETKSPKPPTKGNE